MKKRFLSWVKERIFLIVIVLLYSILAFINLGDSEAPQTFQTFDPGEKILITLPKPEKVSNVMLYTGTTKNDFESYYRLLRKKECNCEESSEVDLNSIRYEDFEKEHELKINGPFQWVKWNINQEISMILFTPNRGREIAFGEIGVMNENGERIDGVKTYKILAGGIGLPEEIPVLTDEPQLVQKEVTAMNSMIFDELYFGQTAYQYANGLEGYEDVHPPLGKILQSIPISLTGKMTPLTWRFMGTVAGILIIIAVYYLALELFEKKYYANIAIILISLSSLHFIQTRVGTVDSHLCLFTILSYLFMFRFINKPKNKTLNFALSGFFFGCAVSVKWSGMFGGIGLAILFFSNLKKLGKIWPWILKGILFFVLIPLAIYATSYLAFPKTTKAESLQDIYDQGVHLFQYHSTENTPHESASPWYTWPISLVGFPFYASEDGTKSIGLFGNYVLCFISVVTLAVTLFCAIQGRDKASIWILIAYLSMLLPYAFISRPMFLYHYLSASIFAILSVPNMIRKFPESKFLVRLIIISTLVSFIALYPRMTGI